MKTSADSVETYKCGSLIYTKRGLVMMFAWMLWGDFCFTIMEAVVPSIVPLHFRSLGASDTYISIIMTSLPALFNFTITPPISMWSDRLRTRWGRRMPFIIGSLPFVTISLLLIGLNDDIAAWVHRHFLSGSSLDQAKVTIIFLTCFVGMFDLFNMFVNTIYWYLFNDVVPEKMLGRFMAQFRIVGTLAGMFYNFFVFRFAESHMKEVYIGAALLYFVGFGLMCLRVREGTYPEPEHAAEKKGFVDGIRDALKTFYRDCFTSRYYWFFMLDPAVTCLAAFGPFAVFLNKSLGLSLGNIGILNGVGQGAMLVSFLFVGRLVDRWHPVRATAYLNAFSAFTAFGGWVWLFVESPNPTLYLWISAITGAVFAPVFHTTSQVAGMTRWMRLLPKEKLGQFSGAMCLVRAIAIFAAGFIAGGYIDLLRHFHPASPADPDGLFAYRYMFLFSGLVTVAAFAFHYKVFRGWKRLGGDVAYAAPSSDVNVSLLPPFPGDEGRVPKGLLLIGGIAWLGGVLSSLTWAGYYTWWEHNARYAMVFGVAACISTLVFLAYLRFIKFMERP